MRLSRMRHDLQQQAKLATEMRLSHSKESNVFDCFDDFNPN